MDLALKIDLEWLRPDPRFARKDGRAGFKLSGDGGAICWTGGVPLVPYEPIKAYPDLPVELSRVSKAADALAFYNKYGSLYVRDPSEGGCNDELEEILALAKEVRTFLGNFGKTGVKELLSKLGDGRLLEIPIVCRIVPDSKNASLVFRFNAHSLEWAISIQLFANLGAETPFKLCKQCGRKFKAGLGSRPYRRRHSEYCSSDCQILRNSRLRSSPVKEG